MLADNFHVNSAAVVTPITTPGFPTASCAARNLIVTGIPMFITLLYRHVGTAGLSVKARKPLRYRTLVPWHGMVRSTTEAAGPKTTTVTNSDKS